MRKEYDFSKPKKNSVAKRLERQIRIKIEQALLSLDRSMSLRKS